MTEQLDYVPGKLVVLRHIYPKYACSCCQDGVTTAIVKAGVLLLHRTVDLTMGVGDGDEEYAPVEPVDTSLSAIAARMANSENRLPTREQKIDAAASANEVAQAVSVAAAYFEDTLETTPAVVLSAGTLGATALTTMIDDAVVGLGPATVQEMLDRQMLGAGAGSAGMAGGIPLGWLAGVRGALAH